MREGRITNVINRHVQDNFWLYVITLLCFFTGIVIGIYSVRYMGGFEKNDLVSYLTSFKNSINSGNIDYRTILLEALKVNIPVIFVIWFLGLTMIGIPVILVIDVLKGFTIGFASSFIINGLGIKGVWMDLVGILPQNIVYVPCIIFSSVIAMEFSLAILKDKSGSQWKNHAFIKFTSYSMTFILVVVLMGIGLLMETYVTPNMMKLVAISSIVL
jgi:stage II sporulation protein M